MQRHVTRVMLAALALVALVAGSAVAAAKSPNLDEGHPGIFLGLSKPKGGTTVATVDSHAMTTLTGADVTVTPPGTATASGADVTFSITGARTPDQGSFGGGTSQAGGISFRVSGSNQRNEIIGWRARCRSGKDLTGATRLSGERISGGGWLAPPAAYVFSPARSNYGSNGPVVGHFRVIENNGQFTTPISATGVWRLSAVLYQQGRKIDSCATGIVRWAAGTIASGSPSSLIVSASGQVGGLTYAQWQASAWQWDIKYLRSHHSPAPSTAGCVSNGQQGPVWFLGADRYDFGNTLTETCNVLAGRYVLFEFPSHDCSTVERPPFHGTTDAELLRCARSFKAGAGSLAFDGQVLSPSGFVVSTAVFPITMPAKHNLLEVPGATAGRAAVYGQVIMLGPLMPGVHTLVRVAQFPGGPIFLRTYRLTVT